MIYSFGYPFVYGFLRLLIQLLGRLRIFDRVNIPKTGALIYCPNHLSDADPPTVFVSVPKGAWFIGKQELFDPPVSGWFFRHFHGLPIKRDSADRAALRRAEDLLKRGERLVIFPEGRCAQDGHLQRIQSGAALLAIRTGVPIIPIGLTNTNQMQPYGDLIPRRSKDPVTITFGQPIHPDDFSHLRKSETIEALTRKLEEELARLTGQLDRIDHCDTSSTIP
jgi:1-acyl-sn-glycerol-3-phosphate acyltransferase